MKTKIIKSFGQKAAIFLKKNSPTILTCVGAVGMVATVILAIKATPKAVETVKKDAPEKLDVEKANDKLEIVKSCWRYYIPCAAVGAATLACMFSANALNKRREASLAAAYAILQQSYKWYKKAANEVYGDEADSKIEAEAAKAVYISADGETYSPSLDAKSEDVLFYDLFSQRYFTSKMAAVINAEYHLNRNLIIRGYANVNEFYEFLGVDSIEGGDDIGWDAGAMLSQGFEWLDFENSPVTIDDGLECFTIGALCDPQPFI